jgi:hypothetical protein
MVTAWAGVGTDEDDALVGAALGEAGVLGQEAEARVHGFRARLLAGGDDLVGDEIGLGGRRSADVHGLVGHLDGQRTGVGVGIDDHRLDAQATARLDHADSDLASVGDQNLRKHRNFRPKILCFAARPISPGRVCKLALRALHQRSGMTPVSKSAGTVMDATGRRR